MPRWNCKQIEYIKQIFARITTWRRLYAKKEKNESFWSVHRPQTITRNSSLESPSVAHSMILYRKFVAKMILLKAYGSSLPHLITYRIRLFFLCFLLLFAWNWIHTFGGSVDINALTLFSVNLNRFLFRFSLSLTHTHSFRFFCSIWRKASARKSDTLFEKRERKSRFSFFAMKAIKKLNGQSFLFVVVFIRLKCSMKYPLNHFQNEFWMKKKLNLSSFVEMFMRIVRKCADVSARLEKEREIFSVQILPETILERRVSRTRTQASIRASTIIEIKQNMVLMWWGKFTIFSEFVCFADSRTDTEAHISSSFIFSWLKGSLWSIHCPLNGRGVWGEKAWRKQGKIEKDEWKQCDGPK